MNKRPAAPPVPLQVGLFVDNVALPIAVLLLGVVLSVLAVVQEVAG